MQRFYRVSNNILADSDAFIDTPVGDEVRAFYLPVFTADHPAAALRTARALLLATGHGESGGPWIPVGAGVHTGQAFVGTVGVEGTDEHDVTVLGTLPTSRDASLRWLIEGRFSLAKPHIPRQSSTSAIPSAAQSSCEDALPLSMPGS